MKSGTAQDECKTAETRGALAAHVRKKSGGALRLRGAGERTALTPPHLKDTRGLVARRKIKPNTVILMEPDVLSASGKVQCATEKCTLPTCVDATMSGDAMRTWSSTTDDGAKAVQGLVNNANAIHTLLRVLTSAGKSEDQLRLLRECLNVSHLQGSPTNVAYNTCVLGGDAAAARVVEAVESVMFSETPMVVGPGNPLTPATLVSRMKQHMASKLSDDNPNTVQLVFPALSMANHDCDPAKRNAAYVNVVTKNGFKTFLVSLKAIRKGEEVLINYGTQHNLVAHGECGCELCSKTPAGTGHRNMDTADLDTAIAHASMSELKVAVQTLLHHPTYGSYLCKRMNSFMDARAHNVNFAASIAANVEAMPVIMGATLGNTMLKLVRPDEIVPAYTVDSFAAGIAAVSPTTWAAFTSDKTHKTGDDPTTTTAWKQWMFDCMSMLMVPKSLRVAHWESLRELSTLRNERALLEAKLEALQQKEAAQVSDMQAAVLKAYTSSSKE